MTSSDPVAEKLRDLIPHGTTSILDLFATARDAGLGETEVMSALTTLRRSGCVSFDGREVRRPPQKPLDARYGRETRFDPTRDDQWFRARLTTP